MRDLIDKLLKKGYSVLFSMEGGFPVIRIVRGTDTARSVKSCCLGSADFCESVEESLQAMILEIERDPA